MAWCLSLNMLLLFLGFPQVCLTVQAFSVISQVLDQSHFDRLNSIQCITESYDSLMDIYTV